MKVDPIAWDRGEAGLVSLHDFLRRYSRQHLAAEHATHTLCGARIPWSYVCSGDSTQCKKCLGIAQRRGHTDLYGERFTPETAHVPPTDTSGKATNAGQ